MLRPFVWIQHGLWLYVDDGLLVVPVAVAPLVAASAVMFLTALGVPLSWRKLDIGTELVWIGWKFNLSVNHAYLPADKAAKVQVLLHQLRVQGAKVPRKEIEKVVIGLLIGFTAGAFWLRPWLSSFYKLLRKPAAVPRLLTDHQSVSGLGSSLPQYATFLRQVCWHLAYNMGV